MIIRENIKIFNFLPVQILLSFLPLVFEYMIAVHGKSDGDPKVKTKMVQYFANNYFSICKFTSNYVWNRIDRTFAVFIFIQR